MKEPSRILAGVSFRKGTDELTEGSKKAASQAAKICISMGRSGPEPTRLLLLHSTHPDERSGGQVRERPLTEERQAALESFQAEFAKEGVDSTLEIVAGKAWREITQLVLDKKIDMVVVGKRNETSQDGRRIGSTAFKLIRNCPGPVWVVRPEHDLAKRLVLAATDLSSVGDHVCDRAGWIASKNGAELHLLYAYAEPQVEEGEDPADTLGAMKDKSKRRMLAKAQNWRLSEEAVTHVVKGAPSDAVREAVDHLSPDLLVLGTISRAGEPGQLLGDSAERIFGRVGCSLLTVKPDDFISPLECG